MGAWPFVQQTYNDIPLTQICRPASGSPAAGLLEIHKMRQNNIMNKIFLKCNCEHVQGYCGMQCDKDKKGGS
jgi:2-oxoglutarate dehydrogenase E1 component